MNEFERHFSIESFKYSCSWSFINGPRIPIGSRVQRNVQLIFTYASVKKIIHSATNDPETPTDQVARSSGFNRSESNRVYSLVLRTEFSKPVRNKYTTDCLLGETRLFTSCPISTVLINTVVEIKIMTYMSQNDESPVERPTDTVSSGFLAGRRFTRRNVTSVKLTMAA
ncbi:uncharacterized protein LOC143150875 [Ptiloglossa arizonensis]|uniref:uncharacterized protein LOC143150875 n=1 Tax=Ptiloglossa arizonensis TaxID=3350558 RepID=UPI003F9FAEEA